MAQFEPDAGHAVGGEPVLMRKILWVMACILVFVVSFVLSIVVTVSWPGGFGGIGNVDWNDSVGEVIADLPYADGELNKFDLYVPADTSRDAYKLVLYIHAGGFTGGDKSEDAMWARYFVSKGFVSATINYTVHTDERPSNVYAMSLEIQQGVAAIVEAAAQRGYELDEMAVAGGSSGGALAMIYAYRDYDTSPIPVKFVVQSVGPASFEPSDWFGFEQNYTSDEEAVAAAAFVSLMTGDNITPAMMRSGEYKEYLKKISPYALVTKDTVPTLSAYGSHDKLVPIGLSKRLFSAFDEHGVTYDYIEFPNSGHGLNRDAGLPELFVDKMNEYLDKYLAIDR